MTILDELAAHAKVRTEKAKQRCPLSELRRMAEGHAGREPFAFERALRKAGDKKTYSKEIAFICECKKASPSRGLIAPDFPYLTIAKEYEAAGADCISVLTEPEWFLGSDEYLRKIAANVGIPCLRKDFTVDEYMIFEAKILGASAVLLICALLDDGALSEYLSICDSLGLSALTEAHDEAEIERALQAGARVIGVNNRNLKDFSVDFMNVVRLRGMIPGGVLYVAESGVKSAEDVRTVYQAGADAILVGEALMRAPDKKALLQEFREVAR